MKKIIIKVIDKCFDCEHYTIDSGDMDTCCFNENFELENISEIHKDCPLEDAPENEYD